MAPLGPLLNALPSPVKIGFAVVLLTLIGIYYGFQAIRAFPWRRPPGELASPVKQGQKRSHRPKRRRSAR